MENRNLIDISGLNRRDIVRTLFAQSRPFGMGFIAASQPGGDVLTDAEVDELENGYLDYVKGRLIKVDMKGAWVGENGGTRDPDRLDPRLHDRDYGDGALARKIDALRKAVGG